MSEPSTEIAIPKEEEVKSDWSKLPDSLIESIFTKLHLDDITSCRSTCKSWRAALLPVTQWLLHKQCNKPTYGHVFHPFYGYKQPDLSIGKEKSDVVPRFSKDGWILMSSGEYSMFFFNPVTQVMISLTDLCYPYEYNGMCFSSNPTSSECVIFGINGFCEDFVNISTMRLGDKRWSRSFICYDNNLPFVPSYCNPVFHNGLVYSLGVKGNLGVYNLRAGTWAVLKDPQKPCKIAHENYLVGCGEKLISVFLGRMGSWISVYKLNDSKMIWEEVDSLKDYALFLSIPASFSTSNVLATMKNNIFLPLFHNDYVVFYSFDTKKFQTFGSNLCTENLQQYIVAEQLQSCWIERRENFHDEDKKLHWVSESEIYMEEFPEIYMEECGISAKEFRRLRNIILKKKDAESDLEISDLDSNEAV